MAVLTLQTDWRHWRRCRRELIMLLAPDEGLYQNHDPTVTERLEWLLRWTDQVADRLSPFDQSQVFVPCTVIGEDFRISPYDNLSPEATFVAKRITDYIVYDGEEGFLDMEREDRDRFEEEDLELKITGGGCKAFHSPEHWNKRAADWRAPPEAILVLSFDGGDLARYMNRAYEYRAGYEGIRQMIKKLNYKFYSISHVVAAVVPLKDGEA